MKILNTCLVSLTSFVFIACGSGGESSNNSKSNLNYTTSMSLSKDVSALGNYTVCPDLNGSYTCEKNELETLKNSNSRSVNNTYTFVSKDAKLQTSNILAILNDGEITFAGKSKGENQNVEVSIKSTLKASLVHSGLSDAKAEEKINKTYKDLKVDTLNSDVFNKNILTILKETKGLYILAIVSSTMINEDFIKEKINVSDLIYKAKTSEVGLLNDTGVKLFFDGTTMVEEEPLASFKGQDAAYGFDKTDGGFKFKKLDSKGLVLADNSEEYSCVLDERSNIIWEIKADDETSPRYKFSTFTADLGIHSNPHSVELLQSTCNKGVDKELSDCKSSTYIKYMNKISYCGKNDWRLPTSHEQYNLLDFSRTDFILDTGDDTKYYYGLDKKLFKDMYNTSDEINNTDTYEMLYWSSSFYNQDYAVGQVSVPFISNTIGTILSSSICQKGDVDCDYPSLLNLKLVTKNK